MLQTYHLCGLSHIDVANLELWRERVRRGADRTARRRSDRFKDGAGRNLDIAQSAGPHLNSH